MKNNETWYAVNIQWDTDEDDEIFRRLPQKVKIPQGMTDDEEISDYLTNLVEFCHYGFSIIKEKKEDN